MNLFSWFTRLKKATCYIHIGMHKTGSTAIQKTLFENRRFLSKQARVYYLPFEANHGVPISKLFKVSERACQKGKQLVAKPTKGKKARKLRDYLKGKKWGKTIISGEKLCAFNLASVQRMKSFLQRFTRDQRVVVYVREPSSWASSWAQQRIQQGFESLEQLVENPPLPEYRRRIQPYIDAFGRKKVEIRLFEEAVKHPDGVVGDFLEALGVNAKIASKLEPGGANESFSLESALLLDQVERARPLCIPGTKQISDGRSKRDAKSILKGIPGRKFRLPPQTLALVHERSHADLEWLTEQLGRNPYPNPTAPRGQADEPGWSEETIRAVGLRLFDFEVRRRKLESKLARRNAEVAERRGKRARAAQLYRKALRLDSSDREALQEKIDTLGVRKSRGSQVPNAS